MPGSCAMITIMKCEHPSAPVFPASIDCTVISLGSAHVRDAIHYPAWPVGAQVDWDTQARQQEDFHTINITQAVLFAPSPPNWPGSYCAPRIM